MLIVTPLTLVGIGNCAGGMPMEPVPYTVTSDPGAIMFCCPLAAFVMVNVPSRPYTTSAFEVPAYTLPLATMGTENLTYESSASRAAF